MFRGSGEGTRSLRESEVLGGERSPAAVRGSAGQEPVEFSRPFLLMGVATAVAALPSGSWSAVGRPAAGQPGALCDCAAWIAGRVSGHRPHVHHPCASALLSAVSSGAKVRRVQSPRLFSTQRARAHAHTHTHTHTLEKIFTKWFIVVMFGE